MNWRVFCWDVDLFSKSSSNSLRNGLNETSLSWHWGVVNTKNVLSLRLSFHNFLDHASKISNMDGGNVVFTFTTNWKSCGVLKPCLFEVTVKDSLSLSIKNTSRDNISSESRSLSFKNKVFNFLNNFVFFTCLSNFVVGFSKSMV